MTTRHATATGIRLRGIAAQPALIHAEAADGATDLRIEGIDPNIAPEMGTRIRKALEAAGTPMAGKSITVRIHPPERRGQPCAHELGAVMAILAALGHVYAGAVERPIFHARLAMDATTEGARGAVAAARLAAELNRPLVVAADDAERTDAAEAEVIPIVSIDHALRQLAAAKQWSPAPKPAVPRAAGLARWGRKTAQAIAIAAAGRHHLLIEAPEDQPVMRLARLLHATLPPMTEAERLDVETIASVCGLTVPSQDHTTARPFRAPHHTVSPGALGGRQRPATALPGEATVAHNGVLLLLDIHEFSRRSLQRLREPMTERQIRFTDEAGDIVLPAGCVTVGTTTPCPCGRPRRNARKCECGPDRIREHRRRIPENIRQLFDLQLKIDTVPRETGNTVPERVPDVRRRAQDLPASDAAQAVLAELSTDENGRARTISVAGTLAAMRDAAEVATEDIREAAGYTLPQDGGVCGDDNA